MNQGIAFSRTLRALDADDFRGSKLWLGSAVLLIGVWTWWMFSARVAQYETATQVRVEQGRAIAYLPAGNVRTGQSALVSVNGISYAAHVAGVAPDYAELVFTGPAPPGVATSAR